VPAERKQTASIECCRARPMRFHKYRDQLSNHAGYRLLSLGDSPEGDVRWRLQVRQVERDLSRLGTEGTVTGSEQRKTLQVETGDPPPRLCS
jgi:hypothetical protein